MRRTFEQEDEATHRPLPTAHAQMAVSLGFHMVFAASGIVLPLLMLMAEALWLRTGQEECG